MNYLKNSERFVSFVGNDTKTYLDKLVIFIEKMYSEIAKRVNHSLGYTVSTTWNPASIADGDEEAKEITVNGASLGDFAIASFSLDVSDLTLDAQVTAANTVTCVLANNTGGAINLGEGTLYVRVLPK